MGKAANETVVYPFTAFNFAVEIHVDGVVDGAVCNASFAECDGLEMTREVRTLREGGNDGTQFRLSGPLSYGTLTLKRGMTANVDLWDWFQASLDDPSLRADAEVVLFASGSDAGGGSGAASIGLGDRRPVRARFKLARCLPIKLKAPALNARDGGVAIEEFQLVYERLELRGS
jgi:phage tail-like protein